MIPMKTPSRFFQIAITAIACCMLNSPLRAQETAKEPEKAEKSEQPAKPAEDQEKADKPDQEQNAEELVKMAKNREQLEMPGMKIMIKKGYIDVDARVCLTEGLLELIACTKDSKEHEALIAIDAKAAHVHAALLLIGAQPGNPAMRKQVETENGPRWVDIPPRGQDIDVYLVFDDEEGNPEEHPIRKFLIKQMEDDLDGVPVHRRNDKERAFPTDTFLFVGSHIWKDGKSDPVYLADESGNVISLSTFGDELLALPGVHEHANDALSWAVDSTFLPELNSKVTLRLKPKKPAAAEEAKKPAKEEPKK